MTYKSAAARVAEAKAEIDMMTLDEAASNLNNNKYVFVDVREDSEVADGIVPGSVHASRGNLEFSLCHEGGAKNPEFGEDKTLVFICGSGGRASLAAKLAKEFGYDVAYMEGGFKAWKAAGKDSEMAR